MVKFATVLFVIVVSVSLAFAKALFQALSIDEAQERQVSPATFAMEIFIHGMFCVLSFFLFCHPAVYGAMLLIIAALSLFNQEGRFRMASWMSLILLYGIMMLLSFARQADAGKFKFEMLSWVFAIVIAIVANVLKTAWLNFKPVWKRIRKGKGGEEND